jgi:DNA-binding NtrC family response regulator
LSRRLATIAPSRRSAAEAGGLGDDLRRREFQMIIDTLRAERGRRKEAAERLGISPRTCATSWRRCVTPGSMSRPACSAELQGWHLCCFTSPFAA